MLDTPCPKCDWRFPGFHICVIDLRSPEGVRAATTVNYSPPKRKSRARPGANRSESVKVARANDPGRAERDAEIIRLYDEMHYSMAGIAKAMKIDARTVSHVIKAAAAADKIELQVNLGGRPRTDAA